MGQGNEDKKIVFCIAERQSSHESAQGFIRPIFEETVDGLVPVNQEDFIKNGLIHVTKGYNKFLNTQDGQFYKVETNIGSSWNEDNSHDGISKYVTFDKFVALSKYLDVCQLIESDYPDPERIDGMTCYSDSVPIDGFFIICNDNEGKRLIIGPLDVVNESIRSESSGYFFKYKSPDKPFPGKWSRINNVSHSVLVFDYELIPNGVIFPVLSKTYLVNCDNLPHESSTQIDLSSDENIIKWASKLFRAQTPEISNQLPKLKEQINTLPNDLNLPDQIFESRKKRLTSFPDRLSKMEGFGQILSDYLRSEEGQLVIKRYVDTNRDTLLNRYLDEELKQKSQEAKNVAEQQISEKEQVCKNLEIRINKLKNEEKELKVSETGIELEDMKQQITLLRKEKEIIYDVDKLNTHKEIINDEIEKLKKKEREAKALLKMAQNKIGDYQEEHKLKLIELKMGLDAISGNVKSIEDIKSSIPVTTTFDNIDGQGDDARLNVIKILTTNLVKRGRIVNQDDVAILLTCIIQNLVVTLAGKPGSGKSSTVSELARVLGIKYGNRYTHIQVQRGWTSDRDILGFYNKLSHSYDPDRFGLYKLINGLQDIPLENQFSIALLDEANLSPIEHYWSGFMGACDNLDSFSLSGTKQGESLTLPKGLRFVATVNYDRTTEPLSARFLDRSPVIYLENSPNSLLNSEYLENEIDDAINFSFNDLELIFRKNASAKFKPDEKRIIEEIIEEHQFLGIRHRKIKAICNFTETLRYVLSEDQSEMLKAFDYAILVHVLPLINGQGREYSKAIKKFNDYLSSKDLLKSSERVAFIISNSQFDAYSYFS